MHNNKYFYTQYDNNTVTSVFTPETNISFPHKLQNNPNIFGIFTFNFNATSVN